jgi:hypothetical protein
MIIVRRPWSAIADGALVIDPAGRIWRLSDKLTGRDGGALVRLTDPTAPERQATIAVNPAGEVETIDTGDITLEHAVDILAGTFALERI